MGTRKRDFERRRFWRLEWFVVCLGYFPQIQLALSSSSVEAGLVWFCLGVKGDD